MTWELGILGIPGEIIVQGSRITRAGENRKHARLRVQNTSRWPVAITSHFHFFEVNRRMRFDRAAAFGMHLNVIAGGSVRWSPGETKAVDLIEYGGERTIYGFNGFVNASLGDPTTFDALRAGALSRIRAAGYEDADL